MNRSNRREYNGHVLIKYSPEMRTITTGKDRRKCIIHYKNVMYCREHTVYALENRVYILLRTI